MCENMVRQFDPSEISVEIKNTTVSVLLEMLEADMIDLEPDFQRHGFLWNDVKMSQLVESLLLGLPLPSFYFQSGTKGKKWEVIDGLQRLCTFKRLIDVKNPLVFNGMKFLGDQWNGKNYGDLTYYERVELGLRPVTLNILRVDTPAQVKFDLFRRINALGTPLRAAEVRHAVYQGKATELVDRLLPIFHRYTSNSVSTKRLNDHDFVVRYLASQVVHYHDYRSMDDYLNAALDKINQMDDGAIGGLETSFTRAIRNCSEMLGNDAFRNPTEGRRRGVSIGLFESLMDAFAKLPEEDMGRVRHYSSRFTALYRQLFSDERFVKSLTSNTGSRDAFAYRMDKVNQIVTMVLNND